MRTFMSGGFPCSHLCRRIALVNQYELQLAIMMLKYRHWCADAMLYCTCLSTAELIVVSGASAARNSSRLSNCAKCPHIGS